MRLLLTFIIFILGVFYTFGDDNCCEQCCEYLENCCKKEEKKEEEKKDDEGKKKEGGKEEVQKEFCLKKLGIVNPEEIKNLVNPNWYEAKKGTASFILYEKTNGTENQNLDNNDVIKVTKDKNGFSIDEKFIPEKNNNEQKWALFEIIYKKEEKKEEKKYLYCSDIESSFLYGIFESCKQYISISVIACNTSNVTDMHNMFYGCSFLTKLNLFNFNTEKVTNMNDMFFTCENLKKLNLSKFDTKNVTNMNSMFTSCDSLQTVTFNGNLDKNIIEELKDLGFTEEGKEEGNIITLKKKQQI